MSRHILTWQPTCIVERTTRNPEAVQGRSSCRSTSYPHMRRPGSLCSANAVIGAAGGPPVTSPTFGRFGFRQGRDLGIRPGKSSWIVT
jgi:hypothetical protein